MHDKRLTQIDFNVPGIKAVGLELMKLMNAPEPEVEAIAQAVELDPALFGSILACANSALYGGMTEIVNVRVAIARLGIKEIRRVVFHVVLDSAFRSDNPDINRLLRALWMQNLAVSLTMQRLIQDCPQIRTLPMDMISMIYPLGLMHTIGIPVLIINYFKEFSRFVHDDLGQPLPQVYSLERERFADHDHFLLGAELLRRWKFPDFLSQVVATYHLPQPDLPHDVRLLHSLLRTARHLTQEMGYAALRTAPEGFWLDECMLDISALNTATIAADVAEQLRHITTSFS